MAIICRSFNLLFIMVPRTACTAIGEVLCNHLGGEYLPKEDILNPDGSIYIQKKHSTLAEIIAFDLLGVDEVRSLLKFCSVRNPFDSLVSLYLKKKYKYQPLLADSSSWVHRLPHYERDMRYCQHHTFESWLIKTCWKKSMKRFLGFTPSMYDNYTKRMDVVMRYENIQADFSEVLKRIGATTDLTIPIVNQTSERTYPDYQEYYSKYSRSLVRFVYHHDLKKYNYRFDY